MIEINGEIVLKTAKFVLFISLLVFVYAFLAIPILSVIWLFGDWEIASPRNIFFAFKITALAACTSFLFYQLYVWVKDKKAEFISGLQ